MKNQFRNQLATWLQELQIAALDPVSLDHLWLYFQELQRWNTRINLVAKAPELQILENHFLDSLTLLPLLDNCAGPPVKRILDVGSGAGFPGLVLKIARPAELEIVLLEPRQKRASFLKQVIRTIKLAGITVLTDRLEKDAAFANTHGQFPLITSRALASLHDFLQLSEAVSPAEGLILCMKGPRAEEELQEWRLKSPASPFVLRQHQKIALPLSGAERALLVFQKTS